MVLHTGAVLGTLFAVGGQMYICRFLRHVARRDGADTHIQTTRQIRACRRLQRKVAVYTFEYRFVLRLELSPASSFARLMFCFL